MKYHPHHHHRRSIRLRGYDYSTPGAYFVTICVKNLECLFGDVTNGRMDLSVMGRIAFDVWQEIPKRYANVQLDEFVVMPNHIHGIIIVNDSNVGAIHELPLRQNRMERRRMLIPKIVGYYKMNTAKQINKYRNTPAVPLWQRNYYERIIRNIDEMRRTREYMTNNPVLWADDDNYRVGAQHAAPLR